MTNLTQHHKALLHRFPRDYDQHMSCPEVDKLHAWTVDYRSPKRTAGRHMLQRLLYHNE